MSPYDLGIIIGSYLGGAIPCAIFSRHFEGADTRGDLLIITLFWPLALMFFIAKSSGEYFTDWMNTPIKKEKRGVEK